MKIMMGKVKLQKDSKCSRKVYCIFLSIKAICIFKLDYHFVSISLRF